MFLEEIIGMDNGVVVAKQELRDNLKDAFYHAKKGLGLYKIDLKTAYTFAEYVGIDLTPYKKSLDKLYFENRG